MPWTRDEKYSVSLLVWRQNCLKIDDNNLLLRKETQKFLEVDITVKKDMDLMSLAQRKHFYRTWVCPLGVMVKLMDCGIVVSSYSSCAITFTFGQIFLGKVGTLLSSQLWFR